MPTSPIAASFAVLLSLALPAAAANLKAVPIGTFERPVHVGAAPGAPTLLFVVEAAGRVQVMQDEKRLALPFLDIADIVRGPPDSGAGGEEGLFSIAFPPDYASSRLFYVAFTNLDGNVEVDEFRRSVDSAIAADPASRRVVLVVPHANATNHNGGQLAFGPDGFLYISVGDGGSGVSPKGERARDLTSLLGKILRIDPRLQSGGAAYAIPSDNPFVGIDGRDEIFSYGLRNAWRFSFDGDVIAIADVGELDREEIDIVPLDVAAGGNFGWPQYEGNDVFDNSRPGQDPPLFPILDYARSGGNCAVIGGHVVREAALKALVGRYLYGDFCSGALRSSSRTSTSRRRGRTSRPASSCRDCRRSPAARAARPISRRSAARFRACGRSGEGGALSFSGGLQGAAHSVVVLREGGGPSPFVVPA